MNEQDKQLLLKDLCARLPYNVRIECGHASTIVYDIRPDTGVINNMYGIDNIKPYLRPMSSMTEKDVNELKMICDDEDLYNECGDVVGTIYGMTLLYGEVEDVYPYNLKIKIYPNINYAVLDYLNSHHFDYRGLIGKGLALEAPEEMYEIN